MDAKDLQTWLQITNTVVIWFAALYTYFANRNRVTNERISSLQGTLQARLDGIKGDADVRLDAHAERLARVERDLQHAPSHDDLKRIHSRMDDLAGAVKGIEGEFKGANNTLHLIHSYLLQGGTK